MDRMKKNRNPVLLFLGLTCVIALAAYVNILPPEGIPSIAGFFLLVLSTTGLILSYLTPNKRHVLLLTGGLAVFLFLRLFGLRHPLYAILLVASVIALEYLWRDTMR